MCSASIDNKRVGGMNCADIFNSTACADPYLSGCSWIANNAGGSCVANHWPLFIALFTGGMITLIITGFIIAFSTVGYKCGCDICSEVSFTVQYKSHDYKIDVCSFIFTIVVVEDIGLILYMATIIGLIIHNQWPVAPLWILITSGIMDILLLIQYITYFIVSCCVFNAKWVYRIPTTEYYELP